MGSFRAGGFTSGSTFFVLQFHADDWDFYENNSPGVASCWIPDGLPSCGVPVCCCQFTEIQRRQGGFDNSLPTGNDESLFLGLLTDVGLCRVHPGAGANTSTLAIRCVIGGEQFGPRQATSAREDWARRFYEIWHYKKIISIYHTPERMADFQRYCPFPILDYSNLV